MTHVVLVGKKNSEINICINFRNLNLAFLKDKYPFPSMEHVLQSVTGLGMMSPLDELPGYK